MKIREAAVLGLLGLVVAGCRNDPSVALLERDNNQKELEIYRLKCRVADLEDQLNCAVPAPATVITGPAPSGPAATRPGGGEEGAAPAFAPPAHSAPGGPNLEPLNVSPGIETVPGQVPDTLRGQPGRLPPSGGTQWQPRADRVELASGTSQLDNRAVMQITLHPALTGGVGNSPAGDEGLLVVVEPRDQAGNILPLAGTTSVALIDPAISGEQARMGRWDFSAAQTEPMLHTGTEPGIHLRLPLRFAPQHDRLEVFVRYTTGDGRTLEARRQIAVSLGAEAEPEHRSRPPAASTEEERPDGRPKRPEWSPER